MKKRSLWLSWYSLYIVCALLGFIPNPSGLWKIICVGMSIAFFIPGGMLIKWANDRDKVQTLRQIRNISLILLGSTIVMIWLNMASALVDKIWGDIFYALLVLVSSPMVCGQYWVLSLFGWSCILMTTLYILKERSKK